MTKSETREMNKLNALANAVDRTMIATVARAYFWRIGLAFGIDLDLDLS